MAGELNDFLSHYGVKGMRWGVRRSEAQLARARGRKEADKAVKNKRKQTAKNRRLLSDSDLNKAIDRMQKEKRLKELTEEDLSPGRTEVKKILSKSGGKIAMVTATGLGTYAVKKAVEAKFGKKASETIKIPKPK